MSDPLVADIEDLKLLLPLLYVLRILHECSCFIEFIKRVGEKRSNARHTEHFNLFFTSLINSMIQEYEC